jgi:hypothetical protein
MIVGFLLFAAVQTAQPAQSPLLAEPAAVPEAVPVHVPSRPRFQGVFTDWRVANHESVEAERQGLARPPIAAGGAVPAGALAAPGSRALGERVGEIVALGDCSEGERVARAAGDFALLAAVRNHCQDKAPRQP